MGMLNIFFSKNEEDKKFDWVIICAFIALVAFATSILWSRQADWEMIFQTKIRSTNYTGEVDIDALVDSAKHKFAVVSFFANLFDVFGICIIYGLILFVILTLRQPGVNNKFIESLNIISVGMIAFLGKHITNFAIIFTTDRASTYPYNDLLPRFRFDNKNIDAIFKNFDMFFLAFLAISFLGIKKRHNNKVAIVWAIWGGIVMFLLAFLIA